MSPEEIRYIIQWENQYANGRFQYLFLNTLIWGTVTAFFLRAIDLAIEGRLSLPELFTNLFSWHFLAQWLVSLIVVFGLSVFLWYKARKKYSELKARQKAERH